MEIYEGVTISPGIAIGKIWYHQTPEQLGYPHAISDVKQELVRYQSAKEQAAAQLAGAYEGAVADGDQRQAILYKRQISLLESAGFSRAIESLVSAEKVNVSYALVTTRDELAATFSALSDAVVADQISDMRAVTERLTYILDGLSRERYTLEEPVIIAAAKMSPSEVMELDKNKVLGFLTQGGSSLSHTSILVKAANVPSLIHVPVRAQWEGRMCIVDGHTGKMYLDPDALLLEEYEERQEQERKERAYLQSLKYAEDVTADGHRVQLYANIADLEDMDSALESGAGGIGLLRSEFQYLGRDNYPSERELFETYKKAAQTMGEKLVIIRTLDIGSEKREDYMGLSQEGNPAMGNRGIRFCLQKKDMFKEQLRAIYHASSYGNLAVMYPMITSVDEIREVQEMVREVKKDLKEQKIPYKDIQQGIVVETPAAVMMARELAREVDFLSVGTNDLTQYTLAMDRQNPHLKDRYRQHHPAILKMICIVIKESHKEGRWAGICGELAADTVLTGEFLRMGVDMLSVVPSCILPVRKEIRETVIHGQTGAAPGL